MAFVSEHYFLLFGQSSNTKCLYKKLVIKSTPPLSILENSLTLRVSQSQSQPFSIDFKSNWSPRRLLFLHLPLNNYANGSPRNSPSAEMRFFLATPLTHSTNDPKIPVLSLRVQLERGFVVNGNYFGRPQLIHFFLLLLPPPINSVISSVATGERETRRDRSRRCEIINSCRHQLPSTTTHLRTIGGSQSEEVPPFACFTAPVATLCRQLIDQRRFACFKLLPLPRRVSQIRGLPSPSSASI